MSSPNLDLRSKVKTLYERHPYPPVGYLSAFFQKIQWDERPTLNYRAAYAASYGSTEGCAERPRILVAGSGTFEPVVVALANPRAEILAVDLSRESLRRLEWQARARGLAKRIRTWEGDFTELREDSFDFVIASGVLHHLPDPLKGLEALVARSSPRAVYRCMVYSYWGRALLYAAKEFAASLGISTPAAFRALIDSLPAAHPYKIYFHLYGDTQTDSGLADGFLHPCDQPFRALELRDFLARAGLEVSAFLHGLSQGWEHLARLELTGELEENFRFFAGRAGVPRREPRSWEWNEALPAKGRLFSRRLGREITFDTRKDPAPDRIEELKQAFFILGAP